MTETAPLMDSRAKTRLEVQDPDYILETAVNNAYISILDEDDDDEEDEDEEVVWLREQRSHNKSLPWTKRPSLLQIGFVMFVAALASSLAEPSRAAITVKLACGSVASDKGMCDPNATQILVSNLQIIEQVTMALVVMFSSGKVGKLSDMYGRKVFIALILALMLVGRAIMFIAFISSTKLPFVAIVIAQIVSNCTGGVLTLVALTNLYIADVTESHGRSYALGISMATLYLGLSIGPVIGSIITTLPNKFQHLPDKPSAETMMEGTNKVVELLGKTSSSSSSRDISDYLPLKFEMGILVLVCLYTYFILPELRSSKAINKSRSNSRSLLFSDVDGLRAIHQHNQEDQKSIGQVVWEKFLMLFGFLKPLRLLYLPADCVHPLRRHRLVRDRFTAITFIFVDCIITSIGMSIGQVIAMYGIYKYDWNSSDIGHYMAVACLLRATILILIAPILSHTIFHKILKFKIMKKQVDMVDWSTAFCGAVVETIAYAGLIFCNNSTGTLLLVVISSFGSIFNPSVNSGIVKILPELKIGEFFGAMSLMKNIFSLASPLIFLSVYKASLRTRNDASLFYVVVAALNGLGCVLLLILKLFADFNTEDESMNTISRSGSMSALRSRSNSAVSNTDIVTPSPQNQLGSSNGRVQFHELSRKSKNLFSHDISTAV